MKYKFVIETNSFPEAHWLQQYIFKLQQELDKHRIVDPKRYITMEFTQMETD